MPCAHEIACRHVDLSMPKLTVNGHRACYELQGIGNSVIVLSNSLGTTMSMWDEQIPILSSRFRVLRYDTRGQGDSEVTPGEYHIGQLGSDVLALTSALGIKTFSFCGISMGGLIGQWLAREYPDRLDKLILCNTALKIGDSDGWEHRIELALKEGLRSIADAAIGRWFTTTYVASQPQRVETIKQQLLACDADGYAANCAAVRDADFRGNVSPVSAPTLVIAGDADPVTTIADCETLADSISGATLEVMRAAHLSNIGDPLRFGTALENFLARGSAS